MMQRIICWLIGCRQVTYPNAIQFDHLVVGVYTETHCERCHR